MRSPSPFLLLIFFFHLCFLSSTNAHSKLLCIEKEKQALLDFKLSFVEDFFDSLSTWSIHNDDCCSWEGVDCDDQTRHVTSLSFGEGLKSYELRPSLAELHHLTSLDFNGNEFPMRIPKFIGSLRDLAYLDLSNCGFFGGIPPHLGNLSKLEALVLGPSNSLYADNLHWLSHLSSVVYLGFSDVNLSNCMDWVSALKMLPNLSNFECRSCSLPPSPFSHGNVSTSLQSLDLSNTSVSFSTFSFLINGSNNLQTLLLDYMKFEHYILHKFLEAGIERARYTLLRLSLAGNNLTKLPFEVMKFPSLIHLFASSNSIGGSLPEILQHLPTNLTLLDLSANFFTGVISDSHFSKFLKLDELTLSNNNLLTFNFSEVWRPPFQLKTLSLRSCKVGPSFPIWITTQKRLRDLDISNSMISRAIPDAFWHFSTILSSLNISHNNINGKIPNLSLSFVDVRDIDLSSNTFHGSIPLFLFTAEFSLDLSNNKFSSFLPFHPRVLTNVPSLINLSSNGLSGLLPNWLFQFDGLISLNLENNKLCGTLPTSAGSVWRLTTLHLSNNAFSGELPYSMKNCTRLAILELANNKFSGVVPSWLGESIPTLVVLTLRSNNFSGDLPSSLCHLQSLQILDLSDNKLSGPIPGCFQNFTSMVTDTDLNLTFDDPDRLSYFYKNGYPVIFDHALVMWKGTLADMYSKSLEHRNAINLSSNWLRGEIPTGLTTLKELVSLDLSRNCLNGSIPDKIGQLTSLEVLKLSSNRLSGEIPQSLASLTFLGILNLSDNNLSGQIPTSPQLLSLGASFPYAGNPKLCGEPLPTECPGDEHGDKIQPQVAHDESFDIQAFLAALGIGFSFGFLGVLGTLHFSRPWRLAFFQLGDNIADRTFVATSLFQTRIKRSLCFRKENGAANM